MIEGVKEKNLNRHHDDRGWFSEIVRDDEKLLSRFGQASITKTYSGVIKAFHWHKKQDDLWFCVSGNIQVVLYDRRPRSKTKGETSVFFLGEDNPKIVLIPKGVAHGYRVLGTKPAILVYFTTKSYNPNVPDEERIPFDDKKINFNWQTKNR
ncbi:dTDP-4-dehydrorhamnose 3,5-epimerase family protein [Patescibacteria group bacterium]|nr:dTDP-4-dehydrorhamnose 3,5-epimerase family protein [Patescibacteria group bacterium]